MSTLASTLGMTAPASPLRRRASRLGLVEPEQLLALAAARGCRHYEPTSLSFPSPNVPLRLLSNEQLVVLLLAGENPYDPTLIRCAAQLARAPEVQADALARLALMERTERVLVYIARAGVRHDHEGRNFWLRLLRLLPDLPARPEPNLPHWSRFVSMPGFQRSGQLPPRWLSPTP